LTGRLATKPRAANQPPDVPGQDRGGRPDFAAEAVVPAPPSRVFALLGDLENHWLLTGRSIQVLTLSGPPGARSGGTVRIRGPLGLGRIARTTVVSANASGWMAGRAEIGRRTTAAVSWAIRGEDGQSQVRLAARIEQAGILDRLILFLGGARWMQRVFRETLRALAAHFS